MATHEDFKTVDRADQTESAFDFCLTHMSEEACLHGFSTIPK